MSERAPIRAANVRPPLETSSDDKSYDVALLRRLAPFARPSLALFVVAGVLTPITSLSGLVQPLLQRAAVRAAIVDHSATDLVHVAGLFAVAITIEFVTRFAQTYTLQLGGQRTIAALRRATYAKVQRLPLSYLDRTPVGRVVTRVTNDADAIGELFASGAVLGIADLLTLLAILGFLLYLDVRLTLVTLLAVPPLVFTVQWIRVRAREAFRLIRASIAQLNAYVAEQVQGMAVVQAFGREAECLEEYRDINALHRDANYRSIRYDALLYSVVESIAAITVAIVLWYGSVRAGLLEAESSALYVGTVIAFYEYVQRFFTPIRDLSQKYTILQSSLAAAERVFALLDHAESDAPTGLEVSPYTRPADDVALELRDVSFGYRANHLVLRDIDLVVRRGERIAIVGPTGSGKTTITALAVRLYDVTAGHVLVDGKDVRELPSRELRGHFAFVPQDVFLFAGTVAENVAAFAAQRDDARIRACLERVAVWDLVDSRGGLEARVDERGANFSVGERQLLAFARALYLDRSILVLDEATANVDSATEARLERAVGTLLEGRTAIVIAHRLSTIRSADRIVVISKGRIAEEGTHAELLAKNGLYARLHALQFAEASAESAAAPSDSGASPPESA
ncbi:MAG: ABC transporter ATP-binding protein/permease [Sandaracinaceae bacterium]|nr:ABC transporter ATP-binding protein/permease [Sandaracinaceae bacterium]